MTTMSEIQAYRRRRRADTKMRRYDPLIAAGYGGILMLAVIFVVLLILS